MPQIYYNIDLQKVYCNCSNEETSTQKFFNLERFHNTGVFISSQIIIVKPTS